MPIHSAVSSSHTTTVTVCLRGYIRVNEVRRYILRNVRARFPYYTHFLTFFGDLNLSSPTGGSANGMPQNMCTSFPVAETSVTPRTFPLAVVTTRSSGMCLRRRWWCCRTS